MILEAIVERDLGKLKVIIGENGREEVGRGAYEGTSGLHVAASLGFFFFEFFLKILIFLFFCFVY